MPRFKRLALLHHSAIILLSICFVTTSRYLYSFIFITLFNKLCDDDDDDDQPGILDRDEKLRIMDQDFGAKDGSCCSVEQGTACLSSMSGPQAINIEKRLE